MRAIEPLVRAPLRAATSSGKDASARPLRLAWVTDWHGEVDAVLDGPARAHLQAERDHVARALATFGPDAVLLGGDIGTAESLPRVLDWFLSRTAAPIYAVGGNHEAWDRTRTEAQAAWAPLAAARPRLTYLPTAGVVTLAPGVALVGTDGWYDARVGPVTRVTRGLTKDAARVHELRWEPPLVQEAICRRWAADGAAQCLADLARAADTHADIVVLTHYPPFPEATWHHGAPSEPEWLPWTVNVTLGEQLLAFSTSRPGVRVTVLSGHTHGDGNVWITPTLHVRTGFGDYGRAVLHQLSVPFQAWQGRPRSVAWKPAARLDGEMGHRDVAGPFRTRD